MLQKIWLLIACLSLIACEREISEAQPPIKKYTAKQQAAAAVELDALPADAVLPVFIADYALLRAQLRSLKSGGA